MSEYMSAWIEIGGPVSSSLVPDLLVAIQQDDARSDWGGEPVKSLDTGGATLLRLYDEQARWGQFPCIEQFCQQSGIAFNRYSDGKYEYDAEVVMSRPGMPPVTRTTKSNGAPVILRDDVEQAFVKLQAGDYQAALAMLQQAIGPDVPALTPLRIIETPQAV